MVCCMQRDHLFDIKRPSVDPKETICLGTTDGLFFVVCKSLYINLLIRLPDPHCFFIYASRTIFHY